MLEKIEYTVNRNEVIVVDGDQSFILNQTHRHIITAELEYLADEFPTALEDLQRRYNASRLNRIYFEFQIVRQWIKCHFGMVDMMIDIDENGTRNFEPCYCPKRGECENCDLFRVCYPLRSTLISKTEINVLRLFVSGLDENMIADTLHVSVNTIKKHRMNMLKKLDLHKTSQLIDYWHKNKMK